MKTHWMVWLVWALAVLLLAACGAVQPDVNAPVASPVVAAISTPATIAPSAPQATTADRQPTSVVSTPAIAPATAAAIAPATGVLPGTSTVEPPAALTSSATPAPAGALESRKSDVWHSIQAAPESIVEPGKKVNVWLGDEMGTRRQGRARLQLGGRQLGIYDDTRLNIIEETPLGLKVTLATGAVLVEQAPTAPMVVLLSSTESARSSIVITTALPVVAMPVVRGPAGITPTATATHAGAATAVAVTPTVTITHAFGVLFSPPPGFTGVVTPTGALIVHLPALGLSLVHVTYGSAWVVPYTGTVAGPALEVHPGEWLLLGPAHPPGLVTLSGDVCTVRSFAAQWGISDLLSEMEMDGRAALLATRPLGVPKPEDILWAFKPDENYCCDPPKVVLNQPAVSGRTVSVRGSVTPGCPEVGISQVVVNWGDGRSGTSALPTSINVQHTYDRPGTYTITVSAYDVKGRVGQAHVTAVIREPPTVTPTRRPTATPTRRPPATPTHTYEP
ncbi:MAG: PKD domain-containing protein [Chloroflexi bacterium]|nr:PKD domain-containing protein [Chloroflexota bacterium]